MRNYNKVMMVTLPAPAMTKRYQKQTVTLFSSILIDSHVVSNSNLDSKCGQENRSVGLKWRFLEFEQEICVQNETEPGADEFQRKSLSTSSSEWKYTNSDLNGENLGTGAEVLLATDLERQQDDTRNNNWKVCL